MDRAFDTIDVSLKQVEDRLRTSQNKWMHEHGVVVKQMDVFAQALNEIEGISKEISRYERSDGDRLLAEAQDSVTDISRNITSLENNVQDLSQEIAKISDALSQAQSRQKNIAENIRYRKAQARIEEIAQEVVTLNIEDAYRRKRQFEAEWENMERYRNDTLAKHQRLIGEISQMQQTLERMQKQQKTDFANIAEDYLECHTRVQTGKMANNDLEKYGKALDK